MRGFPVGVALFIGVPLIEIYLFIKLGGLIGALPTMLEGVALILGGALLLTPGFLTDAIGFLCLIPLTRKTMIAWAIKNMKVKTHGFHTGHSPRPHDPDVIEGEFKKSDEDDSK